MGWGVRQAEDSKIADWDVRDQLGLGSRNCWVRIQARKIYVSPWSHDDLHKQRTLNRCPRGENGDRSGTDIESGTRNGNDSTQEVHMRINPTSLRSSVRTIRLNSRFLAVRVRTSEKNRKTRALTASKRLPCHAR